MAAITDKFNKAADGTGVYPSVASVTVAREKGGSVLTCDDLTGWSKDTAVHFSTYRLLADGTVDTSTQSDWKGIVNGNTITQMTRLAGDADNGHLVGDKVELNPTIGWLDDLVTGILKSHNQDGSLRDNIVQTKNITDKAVKATKIDFSTFGNQTNYFDIGKVRVQWGEIRRTWGKNQTVDVPLEVPFASTDYKVFTQIKQPTGTELGSFTALSPIILSPTTNNFKLNVWNESSNNLTFAYQWVAIGLAP